MKRKDFLRGLGLVGAGSMVAGKVATSPRALNSGPMPPNCTLIPAETAGPFPLDLTENPLASVVDSDDVACTFGPGHFFFFAAQRFESVFCDSRRDARVFP